MTTNKMFFGVTLAVFLMMNFAFHSTALKYRAVVS
jgi:hypothetical protein